MSLPTSQPATLFIDLDNDGIADPGETLVSSGVFDSGATAGALNALLGATSGTTAVNPAPAAAPVATGDTFNAVGNTLLIVGTVPGAPAGPHAAVAGSVLANDTGGGSVTAFDAVSVNGGTVTVVADGSFTYLPAAGFTGADTFTYTVNDGLGGTSVGTVTINVGGKVWYVDNSGANGDGRSTSPFNSLAAVNAGGDPDGAGDIIYVRSGTGQYTGGITLENGQTLWGENEALTVGGFTLQAASTDPTLANAGGNGVTLAQDNTLKGFTVGNTTGADIVDGNGTVGNLTIANVNLTGTGQAIDIDQGGVLNVSIDTLTSTSSTAQGVQLAAGGAALTGTFTATSGAISGATGAAFLVGDGAGTANTGGTVAISYGGTITSTNGRAIDIEDRAAGAGDITLSGNVSHTNGAQEGIFLDDNAAGTITLSGASKSINTAAGAAAGVNISDQTGATINFTGGSLTIDTATGTGFSATGGGTITVQGSGNTINSTSATALNVVDTTIGAGGLTFTSISAGNSNVSADPVNGIVLTNTGSSNGLTVTGAGALGSGGTIQNTTGAGISLTDTQDVSLNRMIIQSTGDSGINGRGVTNFSFTNGLINGAGDGGLESAISFNQPGADPNVTNNISGTLTVTGNTFNNPFLAALDVRENASTITDANISSNTITNPGGGAINFFGTGNNFFIFNLNNATIATNNITAASGIQISIDNNQGGGPAGHLGFTTFDPNGPKPFSDPNHIVSIIGNTITLDADGTNAIVLTDSASGVRNQLNFEILNNLIAGSETGTPIIVAANGNADVVGNIDHNTIDGNQIGDGPPSYGIEASTGLAGQGIGGQLNLAVTNNTITETNYYGIFLHASGAFGESYLTVAHNNVAAPLISQFPASGIYVQAGSAGSQNDAVFLNIFDNISAGNTVGVPGIALGKQGSDPRINVFGILDQAGLPALVIPPTNADVEAFVTALNPQAGTTVVFGSGFVKFDSEAAVNHFGVFPPLSGVVNSIATTQQVREDTNLTIAGANVTAANGASLQVTLSAAHGVLSLAGGSTAELTFTFGDGTADASMTFAGTTAQVNAALASLTYHPNTNFAGRDTISLATTQLQTGGVVNSDSDTTTVVVTPNWLLDANADGKSDILWRGPQGQTASWLMDGTTITRGALLPDTMPLGWNIVDAHGDYNADGKSDLLWRGPQGQVQVWQLDGTQVTPGGVLTSLPLDWHIVDAHGDYNADGRSDIVWRTPQGQSALWLMNGTQIAQGAFLPDTMPLGWNIVDGHGDYNGDGKSDLLWRGPQGQVQVWQLDGAQVTPGGVLASLPLDWSIVDAQGDYNADGRSDIVWRTPQGQTALWLMNGSQIAQGAFLPDTMPVGWTIVDGHGDYNADGKSDLLWRGPQGQVQVWQLDGTQVTPGGVLATLPLDWHIADAHGDYNADGKSDLVWRGPQGEVAQWLMDGLTIAQGQVVANLPLNWSFTAEPGATLIGDAGNNLLFGTDGIDTLRGGAGADTLRGNAGADRFVFDAPLNAATNVDTVLDFTPGEDKLVLSEVIFTNLPAGPLSAGSFVSSANPTAQDANDFVLYNTSSGQVSYDADGNGSGSAIAFATLFGNPTINANDVNVITG